MNNAERFKELMLIVATNYGQKELSERQLLLFKAMAKQWGFEEFHAGVMAHLTDAESGMYFPTMAHIAKHVNGTKKEHLEHLESTAQMQWSIVVNKISSVGTYGSPKFDDPVAVACISNMGGWPKLCACTTDQLVWKGKEFVKLYQDLAKTPVEQLPQSLKGLEDLQKAKEADAGSLKTILTNLENLKIKKG